MVALLSATLADGDSLLAQLLGATQLPTQVQGLLAPNEQTLDAVEEVLVHWREVANKRPVRPKPGGRHADSATLPARDRRRATLADSRVAHRSPSFASAFAARAAEIRR